ncbi:hypothetical protein [Endobacterium cereale]|uniref:hypothetical protein n=1 Tax=Endobacterium cereale TaxID=2663029 RepID=UPI003B75CFA4
MTHIVVKAGLAALVALTSFGATLTGAAAAGRITASMFSITTVTAARRRVTGVTDRRHAIFAAHRRAVIAAILGWRKKRQAAWVFAVPALSMCRGVSSWSKVLTAAVVTVSSSRMNAVAR